jgi:two-component system, NtrC family, response regulator AlgB
MGVLRDHSAMDIRRPNGISAAGNYPAREDFEEAPLLESRNPAMIALLETMKRAAAADTTILLTGESGTGKDILARQIHRWSPRRHGPFVVINCTTLAEQLLENELFGHVRGAFTGAVNDKPGRLEAGDRGTVLIDEISELTPALQAKFLSFVQERSFERVGSSRTIRVDVRLLGSSNRNLEAEVAAGRFREDLYYRLNVITFALPPLRERTEDILPFAQWLLQQISIKAGRAPLPLSQQAAEALSGYGWPGNLRELHNGLEHAVTLARLKTITFDDLPDSVRHPGLGAILPTPHVARLKDFEREHIVRVLAGSSTLEQAAATLGINVTTLWRKRRHYGLG